MGDLTKAMRQCWEAMESGSWDRLDEYFSEDVTMEFPGMQFQGVAAIKDMAKGWFAAFPDLRHDTLDEFESDGSYACRLRITGTHDGAFPTPQGEIPATGRVVEFVSADYITGKDGKITRWFAYPDMAGILAQIS